MKALLLFFFIGLPLYAQYPGLYIQYGQWKPDISGDAMAGHEVLDVAKDLALDKDNPNFLGAKIIGQKHALTWASWEIGEDSQTTLTEDLSFGGANWGAGDVLSARLTSEVTELHYRYQFLHTNFFSLSGLLGYIWTKTKMTVAEVKLQKNKGTPVGGLALTLTTPKGKIYSDFALIYGQLSDLNQWQLRAEAGLDITSSIGLFLGFRSLNYEVDFDQNNFDLTFTGIYGGVHLHL